MLNPGPRVNVIFSLAKLLTSMAAWDELQGLRAYPALSHQGYSSLGKADTI